MRLSPALFGLVCLSCIDLPPTAPTAETSAHQRACQAKGEVLIEKDLMHDEPCSATALRLQALVSTDEDCRAYYGDAGISVSLCGSPKDGGAE